MLGQMFDAPLLHSIFIRYQRLRQKQKKVVGLFGSCRLQATIGGGHEHFYSSFGAKVVRVNKANLPNQCICFQRGADEAALQRVSAFPQ